MDDIVVDFPRREVTLPRPPWWSLATIATVAAALLLPLAAGSGPRSDTQIRVSAASSDAFGPAMATLPREKVVVVWQGPASPPLETTTTTASTATTTTTTAPPPLLGSKPAQTDEETTTTTTAEETTTTTEPPTTTTTAEETTTTTEPPTTTTTTRPSLPGEGVFARIGTADGGDLGAEILVSQWGSNPAVAADSSGNFLVAWEQDGDIWTRLFDGTGDPQRDALRLNLSTLGQQSDPAVAAVPGFTNQFAVVFSGAGVEDSEALLTTINRGSNRRDEDGIWLRYTGSANDPIQTLVNATATTGPQRHPSVVATAFDTVTVVWDGEGPDDQAGIFGARDVKRANLVVSATPPPLANLTAPATVKRLSPAAGTQQDPEVALVGSTPLAVWSGEGPEDPAGIWAVPFDGTDRTPVPVNGFTDGDQRHPAVSGTTGSVVTVAWDGPGPDDTDGINARRFDISANSGRPLSPQFRVNTPADGAQSRPALAKTATGRYTVVFDGGSGGGDRAVFARAYNVNDAPKVADDPGYVIEEDQTLTADGLDGHPAGILANDTDPDGDTMTASVTAPPEHGTLTFNQDGTFSFVPEANFNGVVTFDYRARDARDATSVDAARVTITINSVDDGGPVTVEDTYPANAGDALEDTNFDIRDPRQGLLANDSDPDNDALKASLKSNSSPKSGEVSVFENGTFSYSPDTDFCGKDVFEYVVTDGRTLSEATKVTITVQCVKDAPRARDDKLGTPEDSELRVPAPGLLENDFIDDGVQPKATVVDEPEFGRILAWGEDGSFVYLPNKDYNGEDSFSYSLSDTSPPPPSTTSTSTTTTTSSSLAPPTPPTSTIILTPGGGRIEILPGTPGRPPRVADPPGGPNRQLSAAPAPPPGSVATVIITVGSAEDAPLVGNDAFFTGEDELLTVSAAEGPLANDTDPDFGALTAKIETKPSEGKIESFSPDGSFTYQPKLDFNGRDLFTYTVTNQTGKSATGRVELLVGPQDDKVVATGDKYQTQEDTPLTVGPPGLLGNDIDPDGGRLTIALVTPPTKGTLQLDTTGSFIYAPAPDQNGVDRFTYRINDPDGNEATADVIILIRAAGEVEGSDPFATAGPVNPPPPAPLAEVNEGPIALKPPPPPPPPPLPPSEGGGAGGGAGGPGGPGNVAAPPPPPVILTTEPAGKHRGFPAAPVAAGAGGLGLLAAVGGMLSRRRNRLQPLESMPL